MTQLVEQVLKVWVLPESVLVVGCVNSFSKMLRAHLQVQRQQVKMLQVEMQLLIYQLLLASTWPNKRQVHHLDQVLLVLSFSLVSTIQ